MPFEILADFRSEGLTKVDLVWGGIARTIVMELVKLEPKVRIRIRNFPPAATYEGVNSAVIKAGVALGESDVPELLRDRLNIPEGDEYWIHNYRCMTCVDAEGKPGVWVPHIRRKLHHDHDLKDLGITGKGIKQPWTTTHRLVIGDEKRLVGMGEMLYSVALTGSSKTGLKGFDRVIITPIHKSRVQEENASLQKLLKEGKIEGYRVLDSSLFLSSPGGVAKAILDELLSIDSKLVPPAENTENIEEDYEYKQQLARSKIASRVMAGLGQGKTVKDILK